MAEETGTEYFVGKAFEDEAVPTDGRQFMQCTFTNCRLVYKGSAMPGAFVNCEFSHCGWQLVGEAANTVKFLADLLPTGFRPSIEGILRGITEGKSATPQPCHWSSTVH